MTGRLALWVRAAVPLVVIVSGTAVRAAAPPQEPAPTAEDRAAGVPGANTAHAGAPQAPATDTLPTAVRLTAEQEVRARALEGELRCPVCRSQSIRQSRSFMAEDMRRRLHALIVEGRTDGEIRQYFVDRYGTWVLLTPPKSGFNLAAYLLPALVVGVGAAGLVVAARRRSRAAKRGEPTEPPPPSPQLARLERELEEIE